MRTVAEHAGVSLKTVARVVNRELGVSPDLRERVLDSIRELGYAKPVSMPSSRELHEAQTISVLIDHLSFPFQAAVTAAVQQAAFRRGVLTLVAATDAKAQVERELIEESLRRGVRGLIIAPTSQGMDYVREASRSDAHMVFIDRTIPGAQADSVLVDNVGGATVAVDELIKHGHRRIAIFGTDSSIDTALERHQGYRTALANAGIAHDPALVKLQLLRPGVVAAELRALAALPDPPTAIFALSGSYLTQVLQQLRPDAQVALLGFDEIPLADSLYHGLTVVAQYPEAMGEAAADLLFKRLDGDDSPPRRFLIGTDLIVRGSSRLEPRPLSLDDLRDRS